MNELENRIGKRPFTGQIYPLLQNLEERGLTRFTEEKVHGRKRKKGIEREKITIPFLRFKLANIFP